MRLELFSSRRDSPNLPNLVALQHQRLSGLPTLLVCPIESDVALTPLRVEISWAGEVYIVACDLIRPIRRQLLVSVGELDAETSRRILETFTRLLAR